MNLEIYKQDCVDKIALMEFSGFEISNSNLLEDVSLSESVNSDEDFIFGTTRCSQLSFSLINASQYFGDGQLSGKELFYKLGTNTQSESIYLKYRQAKKAMFLTNGTYWYGAEPGKVGLSGWRVVGSNLQKFEIGNSPTLPIQSLFLWKGKLYCGHNEAPYLTGYSINSNGTLTQIQNSISDFQASQILSINSRNKTFRYDGAIWYNYTPVWESGKISNYLQETYEFCPIGYFTINDCEKKNDYKLSLAAYDRMTKFDKVVDNFINGLKYPIKLLDLLKSLCQNIGITFTGTLPINSDWMVQRNIRSQNLTARQVLQWIAQAAMGFAFIDSTGKLQIRWYQDQDFSIDASQNGPTEYRELSVSEYTTAKIDKFQIQSTNQDIGVIVGTGNNMYTITGNPIFYVMSDAELRPTAQKMFDAIKNFQYVPYSLVCMGNPWLRAGDSFQLTSSKGQNLHALIMSKNMNGIKALKDNFTATGNPKREVKSNPTNTYMQQLRGQMNELTMTLDETKNTLTTITSDLKDVTDNVTGITNQVEVISEEVGELKLTSNSFETRLSKTETTLNGDRNTVGLVTQVSTLNQSFNSFKVSMEKTVNGDPKDPNNPGLTKRVSSLELTVDSFDVVINNSALKFDASGLTIYGGGGFKIYSGTKSNPGTPILSFSSKGWIEAKGIYLENNNFTAQFDPEGIDISENHGDAWFSVAPSDFGMSCRANEIIAENSFYVQGYETELVEVDDISDLRGRMVLCV